MDNQTANTYDDGQASPPIPLTLDGMTPIAIHQALFRYEPNAEQRRMYAWFLGFLRLNEHSNPGPQPERTLGDHQVSLVLDLLHKVNRWPWATVAHSTYARAYVTEELVPIDLIRDNDEQARWRWVGEDGADTEVSGATIDEAFDAAEAAWGVLA